MKCNSPFFGEGLCVGCTKDAEIEELRAALTEAHRQLSLHDYKGVKQIGRALTTIEKALGIYDPEAMLKDALKEADA